MIRSVVLSSIRLAVLVLVVVGVVLVLGFSQAGHVAVETMPEVRPVEVQVQTEALGLSAYEVEQFITVPLEDEFNGVPFTEHLRSRSVPGLSTITLTFKPGTDLYKARQLVTERVAQGPSVVNVGTPPVMIAPLSSEGRVMMVALSSKTVPLTDVSTTAFWRIRPRLMAVPGVAAVAIWGQRDHQLQVLIDPARMTKAGVSLEQVVNTAGDATWTSPLSFLEASSPGADGLIDMPNQRLTVQHILPIQKPADLAAMALEDTGNKLVRLGDVATIVEDHPALRGDAVLKDGAGLIMVVEKLPGANTLSVTKGVESAMADLQRGMPGVTVDTTVFRPATYVESALHNIGIAALVGFLLLVVWLGVSARSWRVALIGLIATVLPIAAAVAVLGAFGVTFNTMTLAGLVMALGVIIDDVVVGTHTLKRRLEHPIDSDDGRPEAEIIAEAYVEVRRPLGWAVAIILLAGLPLLLLNGLGGAFVQPVVLAYSLAVLVSTAAALIVTPVLVDLLIRHRPSSAGLTAVGVWIQRTFERSLRAFLGQPVWAYAAVVVLVLGGAAGLSQIRIGSWLAPAQDRNLLVQWQAAPGTSLPAMDRLAASAGDALRATPGVRNVASHVGQALLGDRTVNVDSAETWITLDPQADYATTVAAVTRTINGFPGVTHTLSTYPEESLAAISAETTGALTVRLYGTDQQTLTTEAQHVRAQLSSIPGVTDPRIGTLVEQPAVQIETDIPAAARYQLKPGDIRRQTAVLIAGIPVGSYYHDEQIFDVTVWSKPEVRANPAGIGDLLIDTPAGGRVPLKSIARVTVQPSPTGIDHDRASRFVDVTANVAGTGIGPALAEATARVKQLSLPLGYHAEAFSDVQDARGNDLNVLLAGLGAAVAAFLFLQAVFQSWSRGALVFAAVPLAAVGAVLVSLLTDGTLTVGVLVGVVLVLGVALRNTVLLVRRIQREEAGDAATPAVDLVVTATKEAAGPVAVTAVALVLALLPFAVAGNVAGMEVLRPVALAVIGGMVTSTLLTLAVLPALYLHLVPRAPAVADAAPGAAS